MKNKYGLECPVNWEDVPLDHNWVAIDGNGDIWTYKNKPYVNGMEWRTYDHNWTSISTEGLPRDDFMKCLWEHPKLKCNEE
ncbi:hypothetical protein EBU94_06270 [bacterium]|nr:hypothetical protein [bacterium]